MTKAQILAIMAAMTAATHTFAQQTFHVELEPYTAKRRVVPISGGPVTAYLRLTPEDPWSIRESGITAPDDDWLWSGPYGSFPGTPPLPSAHTYLLLNGVSSRQYVQIYGHLYRPGPGEGVSPWFRATVPAVDIDWEGFETKAHEEGEHTNTVSCLVTNDITLCRKMVIRPPRDDTSLVWPSQTLSWQPGRQRRGGLCRLRANAHALRRSP